MTNISKGGIFLRLDFIKSEEHTDKIFEELSKTLTQLLT